MHKITISNPNSNPLNQRASHCN